MTPILNEEKLFLDINHYKNAKKVDFSVCVFGSARIKKQDPLYTEAYKLAKKLSEKATIITGGGSGIMEAANKAAFTSGKKSGGFCVEFPKNECSNDFTTSDNTFIFQHLFMRKYAFFNCADVFIVFPGGFGTMDELFELLIHMQTEKMNKKPIFLYGKSFWKNYIEWIENNLLKTGYISHIDMDLFTLENDIDQIYLKIINYKNSKILIEDEL
ncbi:MAG: Rossman fold protein, TIGR00730 family [Alphaproteobacteria bacterium 16-39-46]|nr:MAG: Rossman fold protein, TIGR00730 family [Alphaproteobacteria bacterium 16-39-46]OZA43405.1 MAG: Rossman fold protein, TIGR00730 family [Alphaproteobacteria bacterium 17-39-52]HQS83894.1 TIGR00730 family Rossman fold protein [Alphaproteobacteria bacterium]HQS93717.1 TIGR00730 family Rossman fold protein [Alphaproteobacteria bacterium]